MMSVDFDVPARVAAAGPASRAAAPESPRARGAIAMPKTETQTQPESQHPRATAPERPRHRPEAVACDRCRVPCGAGHFTVTIAFRPTRPPRSPRPPESSATFRLCRSCAGAVAQFIVGES
jgi:hypothetical protein